MVNEQGASSAKVAMVFISTQAFKLTVKIVRISFK
jgi:hypothetical protein